MINFTLVVGARPNFMKIASIVEALSDAEQGWATFSLVHTGQHYDDALSTVFFDELQLPHPHQNFGVGSGTHAQQTAQVMLAFEQYLDENVSDCVVVVGDVNSTLACALVAAKMGVPVAHVEAGLESGDRSMPEEINRLATDAIADYLFCTSEQAVSNLIRRGRSFDHVFLVGNTMIDTLVNHLGLSRPPACWAGLNLHDKQYAVCTLHRPGNVDDPGVLLSILQSINRAAQCPIVFPVHPRTRARISSLLTDFPNLHFEPPMSYLEFLHLVARSRYVITDSGGIQEETTYLGIPCLTLRENTERPETVEIGSNEIIGTRPSQIELAINRVERGNWKQGAVPDLWDGQAGKRIVNHLHTLLSARADSDLE